VEPPVRAWEPVVDPRERTREVQRANDAFLSLGIDLDPRFGSVRPIVLEPWQGALSLDGSSPMCIPAGEFITGDADARLQDLDIGSSDQVRVWMGRNQLQYWRHTHLTMDIVPGRGGGFPLESASAYGSSSGPDCSPMRSPRLRRNGRWTALVSLFRCSIGS
jgi:uncharacterized protein (DUF779 family)